VENPLPPVPSDSPEPPGLPKRVKSGTHEVQDPVPQNAVARTHPDRQARALELAQVSAAIARDNRGKDIVILDLRESTPLVDFFVIATAASRRQGYAIYDEIDQEMKRRGEGKLGIEGAEDGRWILLDYGDFVVHVLTEETREYYRLEDIWGDAARIEQPAPATPPSEGSSDS
jgi:ribosome-associated protein